MGNIIRSVNREINFKKQTPDINFEDYCNYMECVISDDNSEGNSASE